MVANKEVQKLDKSQVKLSVTVKQDEAAAAYRKLLDEYSKKANIDGFRRGKVPTAVLERKFGESIKAEATQNIIEESLKEIFEAIPERPLPYCVPELSEGGDYKFEGDFAFSVTYDVFPDVQLGGYRGLEVERPQVKISKEDEERELEALVEQNSFSVDKDGPAAKGDIVTINQWELDEAGAELAGTRRNDFVFSLGGGYNGYRIDDELAGLRKGESRDIAKTYPADFEVKELAGSSKKIRVELTGLKEKKRPDLNDELAQDISEKYKTLADLKADIRKRLDESLEGRLRHLVIDGLVEQVSAASSVVLPESMIEAELDSRWRQFVAQFRAPEQQVETSLKRQGRSKQDLVAGWRPAAEKGLKARLIVAKMVEKEKIEATDEELDAFLKEQAEGSSMPFEDLKQYYAKNHLLDAARDELKEKKLFDMLLADTKIKKGQELKFVDVLQGNR